ncbi:MAG: CdaR family transcriptional regulator [Gordonia sp.]|nr:CdaR family transcriptional regulator [Gordonia sp. (in: high G+C Gram-positive bacteria)]
MYRLAELDADSAGLVRVIDYFDALIRHGADTATMMRASAALADCVVGMDISGRPAAGHEHTRCSPHGRLSPTSQHPTSSRKDVIIDDVVVGTVWIERTGTPLPLDDMLVDRMALTAAYILQPHRVLTDSEHSANLLFPVDDMAVLTSCAALGIDPGAPIRVLAHGGKSDLIPLSATTGRALAVTLDDLVFVPVTTILRLSPADANIGISLPGTAATAHLYVGTARFAYSLTSDEQPIVDATDLGALNLLAVNSELAQEDIPDLVRVRELAATDAGAELLATLRVYLRSGTLRGAAYQLHLHHSSVAHRLAKLSHHLGFTVDSIENRSRAEAMMMVHCSRTPTGQLNNR